MTKGVIYDSKTTGKQEGFAYETVIQLMSPKKLSEEQLCEIAVKISLKYQKHPLRIGMFQELDDMENSGIKQHITRNRWRTTNENL